MGNNEEIGVTHSIYDGNNIIHLTYNEIGVPNSFKSAIVDYNSLSESEKLQLDSCTSMLVGKL